MFIADFHIHSKYSRATSRDCVPEMLDYWARRKGLDLIGTGDFTHAAWRAELAEKLVPCGEGVYALKKELVREPRVAGAVAAPRFVVTGEISTIYKKNGRVRKVHSVILLPGLEEAEALAKRLERIGNLHSDGRPILGLDCRDLLEITLDACPDALFIPAHIWTPHFSLFGAYSGFDTIEECFGDLTPRIHALETGLSSDPEMNWRLSALDGYALISNSDAHSPANLAREANLFEGKPEYPLVARALMQPVSREFIGTLEFFPEEGKYHWDGHRNCGVSMAPRETVAAGGVCPACGGRITVGVLHRVEALADRPEGYRPEHARRFERLAPLDQVLASCLDMGAGCGRVVKLYDKLLRDVGNELYVLRQAPLEEIARVAGPIVACGVGRLRQGQVHAQPGYDGQYGIIKVILKEELGDLMGQLTFLVRERAAEKARPAGPEAAVKEAPAAPAAGPGKGEEAGVGGLNQEQLRAVEAEGRAVAVIAGPGTGKTHTLVSRIARLVERGVKPEDITAVTFTNKAARELRERLERRLPPGAAAAMTIGTFHGICLRRLRAAGIVAPSIIGEPEALSLLEDIAGELGCDSSPQELSRSISLLKNGALEDASALPGGVLDRYAESLARYGALDYDDILLRGLSLSLAREQAEETELRSHLLVDEFQDTSPVQYSLIRAWAQGCAGVFVIGDPNQAIYGFRGSSPRCFEQFLEDFAPVERVELAVNYRSTPQILRVAAAAMPGSAPLTARREEGALPRCNQARDAYAEAIAIAKGINRMVGGVDMRDAHAAGAREQTARGFEDIAVLYRTNRQAQTLEECLAIEGIPYAVTGRDAFLRDREVRRAAAFFRFLLDPADGLSLRVCLQEADAGGAEAVLRAYLDGPRTIPALAESIGAQASEGLHRFLELAQKYLPLPETQAPAALLAAWMEDNFLNGHQPLELLVSTALTRRDLPGLLRDLGSAREAELTRAGGKRYDPRCVSLMTLHAAKGLEFPVVFLYGASEGLLPYQGKGGAADLEEERRLFYVGVTRAREELTLLYSGEPSRFLAGLPESCLEREAAPPRKREGVQTSFFPSK